MRHEYRRQPWRVKHTRRIPRLRRGRETVEKKRKRGSREKKKRRTWRGCCVGRCAEGNIYERGWVLRVSATERNCTGWGTLIYWVITDPSARASAWCMGFLARARIPQDLARWRERVTMYVEYVCSM